MKNNLLLCTISATSLFAVALNVSSRAESVPVDDETLGLIDGKCGAPGAGNYYCVGGGVNYNAKVYLALTGTNANANVQWGIEQWSDTHASDGSNVKGGNDFDGSSSTVNFSVHSANNAMMWGGIGQNALTVGSMSSGSNMAYGTFANEGF